MTGDLDFIDVTNLNISNDLYIDGTLFGDWNGSVYVNADVGIGTSSPTKRLTIDSGHIDFRSIPKPTAPTATVVAGGTLPVGFYYYGVMFVTSAGDTTLVGFPSNKATTTAGNQKVDLTNIPVSSNPLVVSRKIYRSPNVLFTYYNYYIGTINNNVDTTFTDNGITHDTGDRGDTKADDTAGYIFKDGKKMFASSNQNLFVGYDAGGDIASSSYYNTFVGAFAGQRTTTAKRNTAVGWSALGSIAGGDNVAIGVAALSSTTGTGNTALGYNAGSKLTTGTSNVFLGNRAGSHASQLVSAVNSLSLGAETYTTESNQFMYGNTNVLNHIFQAGNVGIGTATPQNLLNVLGDANITGDFYIGGGLNVTNGAIFRGPTLGDYSIGEENIRFGVWAHTPRIIFDNGTLVSQIDYVGNHLRFIITNSTGGNPRAKLRINETTVRVGENLDRINLDVWGDAYIKEDLYVTGNFTGNQIYGEMYEHNHTGTTLSFSDGVWNKLYFTNSGLVNGFTYTGGFMTVSNLTAQISGVYQANYRLSGSGQNNHIYHSTILINNVAQEKCGDHKKMAAGGDIVPMGHSCFIELNAGDDVQVAVMDYGASGDGDYYSGNLNLVRIGN